MIVTKTRTTRWLLAVMSATASVLPAASQAQSRVSLSPDTTIELSGSIFADQEVVTDDQMGTVTLVPLGVLPDASDVDAYHVLANGDQLYSLDITAELGGGLTAGPGDVVRGESPLAGSGISNYTR